MFYSLLRKSPAEAASGGEKSIGGAAETDRDAETAEDADAADEAEEEHLISPVRFHPLSLRSTQTRTRSAERRTFRSPYFAKPADEGADEGADPGTIDEPAVIAKAAVDAAVDAARASARDAAAEAFASFNPKIRRTPGGSPRTAHAESAPARGLDGVPARAQSPERERGGKHPFAVQTPDDASSPKAAAAATATVAETETETVCETERTPPDLGVKRAGRGVGSESAKRAGTTGRGGKPAPLFENFQFRRG
jgi:hypothetical protein